MDKMEEYLKSVYSYFEEEDIKDFNELQEDLLEQLAICLAEGQTEAEVVANLAPPKEVAQDYYAIKNFAVLDKTKSYVVPKEDVREVFIESQKKKWKRIFLFLGKLLKVFLGVLLIGLLWFSLAYLWVEGTRESHLAVIPLLIVFALLSVFGGSLSVLFYQKRKGWRLFSLAAFLCGIVAFIYFASSDALLYTGRNYYNEFVLTDQQQVSFSLSSDADVAITTVEVPSSEPFSFIVRGNFKESDIKGIEKTSYRNQVDLLLDKHKWFDLFTRTGASELIFFIPKGSKLADFRLELKRGDLRLLDMSTKSLQLNMMTGDVYIKNVSLDDALIISDYGDIVMEDSAANMKIDSFSGKTVITQFTGNLSIDVEDGVSILKRIHSESVSLSNHASRLVLEDSEINNLEAQATTGQMVVKHTAGSLKIENEKGKIVSEENSGSLELSNKTGPTIAVQTQPVNALVSSDSGFIKWVQNPEMPVKIVAETRRGELWNAFSALENDQENQPIIAITSNTGNVKVIKKIE